MNEILSLINEYRIILGALSLLIVTSLLLKLYWEQFGFFWLRVRCAAPIFGKVSKLSKQTTAWDKETGWFNSEMLLCAEFQHYYQNVDKDEPFFGKCQSYLSKAQESGRRNLPLVGWLLIAAMVFIEAMGFSYVLAGWTIPGASESLQQQGAVGIAFLISGLLVYLTHKTGQEMHSNHLVRKVRAWFDGESGQLIPDTNVTLEDNEKDDDKPAWKQLLNRVNTNASVSPSHTVTIITAIFIIAVAIGATYVRGQALDEMLSQQQVTTSSMGGSYQDPYSSSALPGELASIQQEADNNTQESILAHQRKGGWGTFIVLAVIFIFLQIMGIMIGYFTGFSGKESEAAKGYIGKFKNKKEFASYYAKKRLQYSQIAQKYLSRLQHAMVIRAQKNNTSGESINRLKNPGSRTFLAYIDVSLDQQYEHESKQSSREIRLGSGSQEKALPIADVPDQSLQVGTHSRSFGANETGTQEDDAEMEARIRRKLQQELAEKKAELEKDKEAAMEALLRKEMGLE